VLPDDFDSVSADQRLMLLESNERNESLLRELERRRETAGITSRSSDITTVSGINSIMVINYMTTGKIYKLCPLVINYSTTMVMPKMVIKRGWKIHH
jgi:hypothetical protein